MRRICMTVAFAALNPAYELLRVARQRRDRSVDHRRRQQNKQRNM
jgi:hypothetical protein